jgi:hypothetical protein
MRKINHRIWTDVVMSSRFSLDAAQMLLMLFMLIAGCGLIAGSAAAANKIDQVVMHPAIPLLDENGEHVLNSAKPYSPKTSCGTGSGCHDYEGISHSQHFEMGRDEADDSLGQKRGGWSQIASPGYFGGFSCMGAQTLAKRDGSAGFLGDFGAAGQVLACGQCHTGGGWSEKDRVGIRYDQKPAAAMGSLDGDYYNRGTDQNNQFVDAVGKPSGVPRVAHGDWKQSGIPWLESSVVSRWNWRRSGVVENDCLMCHGDYSKLKVFPSSGIDAAKLPVEHGQWFDVKETPLEPFMAWWSLRNEHLIGSGFFREGASALLEFLNIQPETGAGMNLVSFEHPDGSLAPRLDETGKPILHWNAAAFDSNRKVEIPMRRFPANDNCWQCHGNAVDQDRRGFWGFGEVARGRSASSAYKADVHKGRLFTENNDETRIIDSCSACHTQGLYYDPAYANVDLNANHNFPKGHSDIDVRRELDHRPGPKSCEYCHDQAINKVIPSGHRSLLDAHRELWKASRYLSGYPKETLTKITKTHLDVVGCQTCHINGLKAFDGSDLDLFYRYRRAEDGKLKIVPTVDQYQFRYFWKDRRSGRVLRQGELFSAYTPKRDENGNIVAGLLKDPETGTQYELPGSNWMPFTRWNGNFQDGEVYGATHALKRIYDRLLRQLGYTDPDVQLVWMQSNSYVVSHNTRASVDSVPCEDCHAKKQNGSFSALVSYDGLLGEGHVKVLTPYADRRLVEEGLVVLSEPYLQVTDDHQIVANMSEVLYASKADPSLSALKSESAKVASGEWMRETVDIALQRMGITLPAERQVMSTEFGSSEVFEFSLASGDPRLRAMAVASGVDSIGASLLTLYRLEVGVEDLTPEQRQAIVDAGIGSPVSDIFSLRLISQDLQAATDFRGQKVLVKLPYRGHDPKRVKLIGFDGQTWRDEGITPLLVHLPTEESSSDPLGIDPIGSTQQGTVVFAVTRPFAALVLADAVEQQGSISSETSTKPITSIDPGQSSAGIKPENWRSVRPDTSCTTKVCQKALKKAEIKLKKKAKAALKARAEAERVAAKAASAAPADQARLNAKAAKKQAIFQLALRAFEQAVTAVRVLHD